jgi:hypothetical protein
MSTITPTTMSNRALIDATVRAAGDERCATVELLALLGELDERRLYLGEGCSSLFTYCTQVLHLSEHAAYHRIEAARTARRFPAIVSLLSDGALTLTTIAMLRPHLTLENYDALLAVARHKSKREIEQLIAGLAPKPDAKTMVRRLPEIKAEMTDLLSPPDSGAANGAAGTKPVTALMNTAALMTESKPCPRSAIAPLTSERYLLRVTLSAEAHANLRRAQDLMRHTTPTGDAAAVLERALELLVDRLEQVKAAKRRKPRTTVSKPRPKLTPSVAPAAARYIPAQVRRAVWARDGGPAKVSNIALRCRAHNNFESEAIFGRWVAQESCSVQTELHLDG